MKPPVQKKGRARKTVKAFAVVFANGGLGWIKIDGVPIRTLIITTKHEAETFVGKRHRTIVPITISYALPSPKPKKK